VRGSNKNMSKLFLFTIAVIAILFGAWAYHNTHQASASAQLAAATIFTQPRAISSFQLIDADQQPLTLENLKGHWSLLFFGFTNCPDLCPTTLATLNQAYKKLETAHTKLPQILFISVDPERDDPERMHEYLSSFNNHFLGATGQQAQIDQLTHELSVLYTKTTNQNQVSIDHSGTILIINPQGQFYGVFTTPHDANKIAQDMQHIM
jgi:protein SCO1